MHGRKNAKLENAFYHNKGGKQKAAKYYATNQNVLRKDARNKNRNLSETEKYKKGNIKEKDTT